jgi:hypothetical protein
MPPKSTLLDPTLPDVARLVTATVQARDAVDRRSWSHPQEFTGEEWWADVKLANPAFGRYRSGGLTEKDLETAAFNVFPTAA